MCRPVQHLVTGGHTNVSFSDYCLQSCQSLINTIPYHTIPYHTIVSPSFTSSSTPFPSLSRPTMKSNHPKLKTHPRPLFSCGFFCQCTHSSTPSPTNPNAPTLPLTPPPPHHSPPPPPQKPDSSSSSTSQSFTQWKFPLTNSPLHLEPIPLPDPSPQATTLQQVFHLAEVKLSSESVSDQLSALYMLERALVPNPPTDSLCPPQIMKCLVAHLRNNVGAKPSTKILLALCLAHPNRHVAVAAGAVGTLVEVLLEMEGAAAERALAALELTSTVAEGAAALKLHALAVPVMVTMMGKMVGRGREYAISALAVIYGGGSAGEGEEVVHAPPEVVARAVVLALQGDGCTARGRRKGSQLLKCLEEYGRSDFNKEEEMNDCD